MIRIPYFVIIAIVAFNITAFTFLLQMDFLIFHSVVAKIVCWLLTIGAWTLAYVYRNKTFDIRTGK